MTRTMGKQSRAKHHRSLSESVASQLKSLYQQLHGEAVAEILFDCWESKRCFGDDPLSYKYSLEYSKGKISPRRTYDIIWSMVDSDWHLWELVQAVDPSLRKEWKRKTGNSYPFNSAIALYLQVISESHSFFLYQKAIDEKGNYQASPRNLEKFGDQVEEFFCFNLNPAQKRERKKKALQSLSLIPDFESFSSNWEEDIFSRCPAYFLVIEKGAKGKNATVRRRFDAWQRASIDCLKLQKPLLHGLKSVKIRRGCNEGETVSIALH